MTPREKYLNELEKRGFNAGDADQIYHALHAAGFTVLTADRLQQLEEAINELRPEIENEIDQRMNCGEPNGDYCQRLIKPWGRVLRALNGETE